METIEAIERIHQDLKALNLATFELKEVNRLIERAFRAGLTHTIEQTDPLAGYSNLTAAIKAGDPIDWEKLDGLVAKCVHPTLGDLLYPLEVDGNGRKVIWKNEGNFWFTTNGGSVWAEALSAAWHGQKGWTLWVEGEIPMRRKTADQLEAYTYFYGEGPSGEPDLMYVGGLSESSKIIYFAPEMRKTAIPATEWVVIEEYGPFRKPEENQTLKRENQLAWSKGHAAGWDCHTVTMQAADLLPKDQKTSPYKEEK